MPVRRYDISNTVLDQGRELGLKEPVLDTVKHMLVNSARVTHKMGNRRYEAGQRVRVMCFVRWDRTERRDQM